MCEILSVCLRRPCVRFAICMTVHRSKRYLETYAFLIQDMVDWWFGLLSYACVFRSPKNFILNRPGPGCLTECACWLGSTGEPRLFEHAVACRISDRH